MHLDSANLDDVKKIQASSIFKGITTNPTILVKEKCNRQTAINRILELTDKQVFVQTVGFTYEEILADARMLLTMFGKDKIAIKIPAHEAGTNVIDIVLWYHIAPNKQRNEENFTGWNFTTNKFSKRVKSFFHNKV